MSTTRINHYVPIWYQSGFLNDEVNKLEYLNLLPDEICRPDGKKIYLPDGQVKKHPSLRKKPISELFCARDLYTTFFGVSINDEIERLFFGEIDNKGSKAVRAFLGNNKAEWRENFINFFSYIDAQKLRTPKGLDWIKAHYPSLNQIELMTEMQAIRNMNCTIWAEGVKEIVTAKSSKIKFIVSDHPVTIYNRIYNPASTVCIYPHDPAISLKGSQTIFPLDQNRCLILTHYEYAISPETEDPSKKRTNARNFSNSIVKTDEFITSRSLKEEDVIKINHILKFRAKRYIAAPIKEWLYPERMVSLDWTNLGKVLLPPKDNLGGFGGEIFVGYKDETSGYQDSLGREQPENPYLKKKHQNPTPDDHCGCGSAKTYSECCMDKPDTLRPTWEVWSIRERNIMFYNGIINILRLNKGKTWDDVRRELSDDQVKEIHRLYGFLWPKETDLATLLPRSDKTLRAMYTGILDPRVIQSFGIGLTPYFDEIVLQNPFPNPVRMKPEYNPIESPHQYKLQTLKNVFLFLQLMPFIDAGYIHYIPDPCSFDSYLQTQMFDMAENRYLEAMISSKDKQVFDRLNQHNLESIICTLPEDARKRYILNDYPNITKDKLEEYLKYVENKSKNDPFTLLQGNLLLKDKGGQLTNICLVPNFEMTLYLAQLTGSVVLTDSQQRWDEFNKYKNKNLPSTPSKWADLIVALNNVEYFVSTDAQVTLSRLNNGILKELKKVIKEIFISVNENPNPHTALVDKLIKQFNQSYSLAIKQLPDNDIHTLPCKLQWVIPTGGIVNNNVRRLLLSAGNINYSMSIPIAILAAF